MSVQEHSLLSVERLSVGLMLDGHLVPVVRDISFSIGPGEVLALVGESGSGKTLTALSLMQLLGRGLRVTGGSAVLRPPGREPADVAKLDADSRAMRSLRGPGMGMIFQEPMASFSPVLTIGSQIAEVAQVHWKLSKHDAMKRAEQMLERVGIPDPARSVRQYPDEFSGGMRQRAMIAKALICDPCLLIADEPTTALDVTIQAQILSLIKEIQVERRMGVLFITHDLGVVAQMAHRVAVMYAGRIVERGPVREIFRNPRHPYTRGLLQAVPRLGSLTAPLVPVPGAVPGIYDVPAGCAFRPRCAAAEAGVCDSSRPELMPLESDDHAVACFRAEGVAEAVRA